MPVCGEVLILGESVIRHTHAQAELQQQFVRDPLLAPSGVLARHFTNQMLERGWDRWPASFGLPAPEKAEALTVPGDEGPGPHEGQCVSPIEPTAESHPRPAGRVVGQS